MKKFLLLGLIILKTTCFSQSNFDECYIDYTYNEDAHRLALRHLKSTNSPYKDSIEIPQTTVDTFAKALTAFHNSPDLYAYDSIVYLYSGIKTFESDNDVLDNFEIHADSTLPWVINLKNGNLPCGQQTIDSLIDKYDLSMSNYDTWSLSNIAYCTLSSPTFLNMNALVSLLEQKGIEAYTWGLIGGGYDITASKTNDIIELNFITAWGDCPAGCMYNHIWSYEFLTDCNVSYKETSGTPILSLESRNKQKNSSVYPNPFSEILIIPTIKEGKYSIRNITGEIIITGSFYDNSIKNLGDLSKGIYLLVVDSPSYSITTKIIKK